MVTTPGQRFVRRHDAARTSTSNTTAADISYDTAVLSEGGYSWSSPEVTVDTAGQYLCIFDIGEVELSGSTRAVGTLVPSVNTTDQTYYKAGSRYLRNTSGSNHGASFGCAILDLAASDDVKIRSPGAITETDALGNYATNVNQGGGFQLIYLGNQNYTEVRRQSNLTIVETNANATRPWIDSTGTWTQITFTNEISDDDALYSGSGGDITLKADKKYAIVYGGTLQSNSGQRVNHLLQLEIAGTNVQYVSGYERDNSSEGPPMQGMYFHEVGGTNETLKLNATIEQEDAAVPITPVCSNAYVQVVELPDSAEWIHADNSTTDSLATALAGTTTYYDTPLSATFRADGNSDLSLDGANDAIQNDSGASLPVLAVGWNNWDRDAGTNAVRKQVWSYWDNGGTRLAYGISGEFSRGQQGNDDCFHASFVGAAAMDLANAADLSFVVRDPVSAANSDMGVYASTSRHFLGVQVLNLNTLVAADTTISVPLATLTLTGNDPVAATGASWDEAENTAHEANVTAGDENTRLRIQIRNDGAGSPATQSLKWQYNYSGDAGWNDLTSTSTYLKTYNSGGFANGDDLAVKLLSGAEDFLTNNNAAVDAAAADATFTMTDTFLVGDVTESEVALTVVSADVADSTTITLRLVELRGSVEIPTTLTNTPTINVTKAGGGATVSVPSATLTLTGNDPAVAETDRKVSAPPVGTLTLTGNDPAVRTNFGFAMPVGTLTLTGNDPKVVINAGFAMPVGTLTLTGNDPAVVQTDKRLFDVPSATLTLTGNDPTVVETARVAKPIPLGTLTLTANDPSIVATDDRSADVPLGTLTLTASDPVAVETDRRISSPPLGTLTLTANDPAVVRTDKRLFDVPLGTLTLTSNDPSVAETDNLVSSPPLGTLTLTSLQPSILRTDDHPVDVPSGALTLNALDPTFKFEINRDIPKADLTLSALAPTIKVDFRRQVPVGALTLTGNDPTSHVDFRFAVPTGTLTLGALDPSTKTNFGVPVPTGTLTLTSNAPSLKINFGAAIPAGTLTLTALQPVLNIQFREQVPVGALTLTANAPTAKRSFPFPVPVGTLALTALDPTTHLTQKENIPVGTLALTANDPAISVDFRFQVPVGALTLTANDPSVRVNFGIPMPLGALTLIANDPNVARRTNYPIPLGTLSLTILQPTVNLTHKINMPAGSLSLQAFAPTVQHWGEVVTDDDEVWTLINTADTETWTGISTGAEAWTPITTGAETWTEVSTSDSETWTEIPTKQS